MKYLIGIDGGGTKTHCIVTDINLNILFECYGGASNFLMIGTETVSQTLLKLIDTSRNKLSFEYSDIASLVLGTTGAGRRLEAEKMENAFKDFLFMKNIILNDFYVDSDARIALESAFSGKTGCILIAGTGSIMFGKDDSGTIHRIGGFGRFIGDEGSGYLIGKKGLIAISKNYDGRGEPTLLSELISKKFGINSPEVLITEIYKNNFDIASVAPLVIEAASKGDSASRKIIEEETDELVLHIIAMKKKIPIKILYVSFIGGLIANKNIYSDLLRDKIAKQLKDVEIKLPDNKPAFGAVLMAKDRINKF